MAGQFIESQLSIGKVWNIKIADYMTEQWSSPIPQ